MLTPRPFWVYDCLLEASGLLNCQEWRLAEEQYRRKFKLKFVQILMTHPVLTHNRLQINNRHTRARVCSAHCTLMVIIRAESHMELLLNFWYIWKKGNPRPGIPTVRPRKDQCSQFWPACSGGEGNTHTSERPCTCRASLRAVKETDIFCCLSSPSKAIAYAASRKT